MAERVTAVDSRIENVVKTQVRCAMAGHYPGVHCWDVESSVIPSGINLSCDVLHHVGVLYHLRDPVGHLERIAPKVSQSIMLDTHVASQGDPLKKENGYCYYEFSEHGRKNPFAGMYDYAKWLLLEDLEKLLGVLGFRNIEVAEKRNERNGLRVLIYAHR